MGRSPWTKDCRYCHWGYEVRSLQAKYPINTLEVIQFIKYHATSALQTDRRRDRQHQRRYTYIANRALRAYVLRVVKS